MTEEAHVYDLFDLGSKRIGVCMPSRQERKAYAVIFEGRVFIAERKMFGEEAGRLIAYREVTTAEPKVIIYGR